MGASDPSAYLDGIFDPRDESRIRTYKPSASIHTEGALVECAHYLHVGRIALVKKGGDGQDRMLHTVDAGELLGVPEIIDGHVHAYTAVALEESTTHVVERDELMELLHRQPHLLIALMKTICARLDRLENQT